MSLRPGQTTEQYEILAVIGEGGMGRVYRARDTRLGREVAIKELPDEWREAPIRASRFEREARTLASLNHPNIAQVYNLEPYENTHLLVMEFVDGEDLSARIGRGRLPVSEAVAICRQVAEGLEAAHEVGVIHRDLKPENIRITREDTAKILDFGLARPVSQGVDGATIAVPDGGPRTIEGTLLGTPAYMSPEQVHGRILDKRSDIWAFGCVLYECLTGERAFPGESMAEIIAAVVAHEPDLAKLPQDCPPTLRKLLGRCLDKTPRTRLRDIGEARVMLDSPLSPEVGDNARPSASRNNSTTALVVTLLTLLATLIFWMTRDRPAADAQASGAVAGSPFAERNARFSFISRGPEEETEAVISGSSTLTHDGLMPQT